MLKEIREDINGKTTHVHELKDLILLKHQYYSKQSTDLLQSLQKSQRFFFFAGIKKLILKCIWKLKELQIAKTALKKKKKKPAVKHPDFKIYNKATVNKTVWY